MISQTTLLLKTVMCADDSDDEDVFTTRMRTSPRVKMYFRRFFIPLFFKLS